LIYELITKLLGSGLIALLQYLPLSIEYQNTHLTIATELSNPVTKEITSLCMDGMDFGIKYELIIIINNKITFTKTTLNILTYNRLWSVNGNSINESSIQKLMGKVTFSFNNFKFHENDQMYVYIRATIVPNEIFKNSTGLESGILWKFFKPHITSTYIFSNGVFTSK
jgi:hypothetical protein